jgi:hypothetical protein
LSFVYWILRIRASIHLVADNPERTWVVLYLRRQIRQARIYRIGVQVFGLILVLLDRNKRRDLRPVSGRVLESAKINVPAAAKIIDPGDVIGSVSRHTGTATRGREVGRKNIAGEGAYVVQQ